VDNYGSSLAMDTVCLLPHKWWLCCGDGSGSGWNVVSRVRCGEERREVWGLVCSVRIYLVGDYALLIFEFVGLRDSSQEEDRIVFPNWRNGQSKIGRVRFLYWRRQK